MSGQELRQIAEDARLWPVEICHEAGISSPTLYKVYKDVPVRATTRVKVEQAILRLSAKARSEPETA